MRGLQQMWCAATDSVQRRERFVLPNVILVSTVEADTEKGDQLELLGVRYRMSAIGTKRTLCIAAPMSAFGGKADSRTAAWNVRF